MCWDPTATPSRRTCPASSALEASGSRGYRGHLDLTAEKFVANPFGRRDDDRLYKTGDRVRRLANGDIEFLGRQDGQVQIRGFRIELDEIATVLRSHAGITDAVVVVHGNGDMDKRSVAYCTGPLSERLSDLRGRGIARLQVLQASIDRAARYPCRPRHHAHAAISGRPRLRGAEQPPASFVEARAQSFETAANRCLVNHALGIDCTAETGNPPTTSKGGRPLHKSIHLFCGVALVAVRVSATARLPTISA